MTQQELREGSFADMVVRIASERRDTDDVVSAEGKSGAPRRTTRPRPPQRLFPDAPPRATALLRE
jgi:hypothetical protein